MNRLYIYHYPASSKGNKYLDIIYRSMNSLVRGETEIFVKAEPFFSVILNALSTGSGKRVLHIHWENSLYGSKFFPKSALLLTASFVYLGLLKLLGFKIVWTMHNNFAHESFFPQIDRLGRKLIFFLADAVIIQQSKKAAEFRNNNPGKRIYFIPHPAYSGSYGGNAGAADGLKQKYEIHPEDTVLLSLGINRRYKRADKIIGAVREIKRNDIKLIIAGNTKDDLKAELLKIIGNDPRIILDGRFIPDDLVPSYFSIADYSVFWYDESVLTSGSIMLSLSLGVPVITRNGIFSEAVKHSINGQLFSDEQGLKNILNDLKKGEFSREKILEDVRQYDPKIIADKTVEVYLKLWARN